MKVRVMEVAANVMGEAGQSMVVELLAEGRLATARVCVRLEVDTRYTCKHLGKNGKVQEDLSISFEQALEYYRLLGFSLERLHLLAQRKVSRDSKSQT